MFTRLEQSEVFHTFAATRIPLVYCASEYMGFLEKKKKKIKYKIESDFINLRDRVTVPV